jgi:hypothetical protein
MKPVWSEIFLVLYLVMFHPADSFSLGTVDNETTIVMTADMLPMLTNFKSINSTAIEYTWHPSPSIVGIDLDQLEGLFIIGLYAGVRNYTASSTIIYNMGRLNETGQKIINELSPDTVHHVCYQSKWYKPNTTLDEFSFDGLYRRECGLLRTYMAGKQH